MALPGPRRWDWTAVLLVIQAAALLGLVIPGGGAWWAAFRVLSVVAVTAVLVVGVAWSTPGWRATFALLGGIGGTVVGAGIGGGHLAKGELDAATCLGLVVLTTGVLLLVIGAVTAIRAAHGWWRLLALPIAYVIAQFILLPASVAVYATNVPPTTLGTGTPARYGLPYEDVAVRTTDGVTLSGWYLPSTNRAAVVLLHGAGSTRTDVLEQAEVLVRHGFGVLMPDARGHGRSGGHAMDFGWYAVPDVEAAVSYLTTRPDVDPGRVGVVGMSMGGEEAVTAAAADPRIKAVVAEGVSARAPGDDAWLPHNPIGLISRAELAVTYRVAEMLTGAPRPIPLREAITAAHGRPTLIIASGADGEIEAARFYRAAAPDTVQVWELPDTTHTQGIAAHHDEWAARVTTFLDASLNTAG